MSLLWEFVLFSPFGYCLTPVFTYFVNIRGMEMLDHMLREKKPNTKGHILYDFTYLQYPEQANQQRQKSGEGARGRSSYNEG